MAGRNTLDDRYAINAAKTELREGYNNADVERILAVFADGFTDLSAGQASFYRRRCRYRIWMAPDDATA